MLKSLHTTENDVLLKLLYRLRISSGCSQSELAKRLGVSQSIISKIESGERRVDFVELIKICVALDSNIEEFVREYQKYTT